MSKSKTVLLIDHPRGPLARLIPGLKQHGYRAVLVVGEAAGLKKAGEQHYKAILISSRLRGVLAGLAGKGRPSGSKIIVIHPAVRAAKTEPPQDLLLGADDFMIAPVSLAELIHRINWSPAGTMPESVLNATMRNAYTALQGIVEAISVAESDFTVLNTTAKELERFIPGVSCSIMMVEQGKRIAYVVAQGTMSKLLNIPIAVKKYPEIRKVLQTKRPLAITDVQRHPLMREVRDLLHAKALYSLLVIPILFKGEVIGLIFIRSIGRIHKFDPHQIRLCELVARAAAVALNNIHLSRLALAQSQEQERIRKVAVRSDQDHKRFQELFERASDGLIVVDQSGIIEGVNANFSRLTGYSKDEIAGRDIETIMRPLAADAPRIRVMLRDKSRQSTQPIALICKNETRRYVTTHIEPLLERCEILVSIHDITDEQELKEELHQTKDFLEKVIQNSIDAIIAADMKGTIILFNEGAERIYGYKAEEMVGQKNIVDFYEPGSARAVMRKLRSPEYGGVGKLETTHNTIIAKNGDHIPINMTASIIYEGDKEVATVGIFHDLRERVKVERELRKAQERLMESQRRETIMALSGAAAHQLNQPLTSILGYCELLRRVEQHLEQGRESAIPPESVRNAINTISQEAERMADIVRKMGEATEFETEEYVGRTRIIDLDKARVQRTLDKSDYLYLQPLMQSTHILALIIGEDTIIRGANRGAVELTGEDPAGKSIARYLPDSEYPALRALFDKVVAGETVEAEINMILPNKEKRLLKGIGFRPGNTDEIVMLYTDITGQRKIEQELRDLTAFQSRILDNTTVPMATLNIDGRINFWNRAAEIVFGYTSKEMLGQRPENVINQFSMEDFQENLRQIREEGQSQGQILFIRKNGERFRGLHWDAAMRDDHGELIGFITIIIDLSERHAFERALQDKTEQIEMLKDVATSISTGYSLHDTITRIFTRLLKIVPFDYGVVTMTGPDERSISVLGMDLQLGQMINADIPLAGEHELVRSLLFVDQPKIIDDFSLFKPEFTTLKLTEGARTLQDTGIRAIISSPLIYQNQVMGSLHLGSTSAGQYSEEDLNLLKQVTGQIGMALANARLLDQTQRQTLEIQRKNRLLESLAKESLELREGLEPNEVIHRYVRVLADIFPDQTLTAWVFEKQIDQAPKLILSNPPESQSAESCRLGNQLLTHLSTEHKPMILTAPFGQDFVPYRPGSHSAIIAPIITWRELTGFLMIESELESTFTKEELDLVQLLSNQLGVTLRNMALIRRLSRERKFQETLMENANALVVVLDGQAKVAVFNRALAEALEVSREEALGRNWMELEGKVIHSTLEDMGGSPLSEEDFRDFAGRALARGGVQNVRGRFETRSGKEVQAVFNIANILDDKGNFQGLIAIGQNITRFSQLEQHLIQSEKLASLGQMAAGIAHELNNPLAAVFSSAQMLLRNINKDENPDQYRSITRIKDESERMERLIRSLMSYARLYQEQMAPLDIAPIAEQVLTFSRYDLTRGEVKLINQIPEGLPAIMGIRDQIQQVLINLLSNASYACQARGGGQITIGAEVKDNSSLELIVEDSGEGIPEEILERIFNPFFTTKPEGQGTGLGLSIVKEIIERHRGKINVQSKPGEGTTVTVTFPLYQFRI